MPFQITVPAGPAAPTTARRALTHWLSVHNAEPYGPVEIARGLDLARAALEEVAVVIKRWGRGEPLLSCALGKSLIVMLDRRAAAPKGCCLVTSRG